ncbi:hypothetical protein SAMN02800692_3730 [Luteibacter sp. UNC138MFCol5.1]|nr:hypothetical protein SAMN02800692_3730 [Luteibacter sp. UNC138MFCol5.1]
MCRVGPGLSIHIEYIVDGEIQSGMSESLALVEANVLADVRANVAVTSSLVRLDAPASVQVGEALLVYLRKEF